MTCDERDQEILLLAHGALSLPRRLAVRAHLYRCAACRQRYNRLTQVSSALSSALRVPHQTPWVPAWKPASIVRGASGATFGARLLAISSLLLVVLTATILYLAFSGSASSCHNNAPQVSHSASDGCSPSLPNDRCR